MATNVITPVIDLTPSAEGSALPVDLARAIAFGSQSAFDISNTTTVIANTPGFYRIFGTTSIKSPSTGASRTATFQMSDGLSTKNVWIFEGEDLNTNPINAIQFDFVVFLDTGESISGISSDTNVNISGSSRQVADINGEIVNPSGFVQQ